jgi:hypothetical protein
MRGRRRLRSYLTAIKSSAGVRLADDWPTHAAASGSAAPGAAVRCEGVRRNCCNDPEARSPRAASGRAPDNPDSNTAPSNRADIAFVCLAKPRPRRRKEKRTPPKRPDCKTPRTGGDCAPEALVSQGKSIQLVVVLLPSCGKYIEPKSGDGERLVLGPELLSIRIADEASARWKVSLRADPLSSARRRLAAASLRARLFRRRCWLHHLCRRRSWACCSKSANRD